MIERIGQKIKGIYRLIICFYGSSDVDLLIVDIVPYLTSLSGWDDYPFFLDVSLGLWFFDGLFCVVIFSHAIPYLYQLFLWFII